MPQHKVPVTMRDFFWDDPFFSNVWEDFDRLRNSIWKESRDMFSRFEQEHRSSITDSEFKSSSLTSAFPGHRRWLMPKGFFDDPDFSKVFPTLKDEVLKVTDNDEKFEVSVDTHGYEPNELKVKVLDNVVTVEAKHEENKEEGNNKSFVSRQFSRSYTLPRGCKMEDVTSNLSADGVLMITATKTESIQDGSRKVPIEMKKRT